MIRWNSRLFTLMAVMVPIVFWVGCMPEDAFIPEEPTMSAAYIIHDDALCEPASLTIEAWIYTHERVPDGGQVRIMSKYGHLGEGGQTDHSYRGWEWILYGQGNLQFRTEQSTADQRVGLTLNSTGPLPVRQWVHVATVFDVPNEQMRLYINGALNNSRALTMSEPINCNDRQALHFGRYGGRKEHLWSGKIDNLRIVGDALTFDRPPQEPYEVNSHPETIALYDFEDIVDGRIIRNAVGNSLPIIVEGAGDDILAPSLSDFGNAMVIHWN